MAIVGYARVSSQSQSLDVQIDKLNDYGCSKIFQEKCSVNLDREQLSRCMDYIREGDKLVITKLDRLARSVLHLSNIADKLKENGIELVVIDQGIDTSTSMGKLMFNMLAAIAEFEMDLRRSRQAEGIAKALEKGIKFGARRKITDIMREGVIADRDGGMRVVEIMSKYDIGKASVYRILTPTHNGWGFDLNQ